jgi:sugar phosphate isomerase/epimerase
VVASYGSYYRVGQESPDAFAGVLETAVALGAPIIRVWAGRVASRQADAALLGRVAEDGRRIAETTASAGLRVACEWHGNTLTDTAESAAALFGAVGHPAFQTYWQPREHLSPIENLRDMDVALPHLAGLHVFHWDGAGGGKAALAEGASAWRAYLAKAVQAGGMFAHLEFVIDDDPRQMVSDAATLRGWLSELRTS